MPTLTLFSNKTVKKLEVTYENSEPSLSKEIGLKLQKALMTEQQAQAKNQAKATGEALAKAGIDPNSIPTLTASPEKLTLSTDYVYGDKDTSFFDTISPIFIGFFVFFFVFLIAGISFLRERTTGTLERLMATPIKRIELELGYLIGFGIFALLQSILVAVFLHPSAWHDAKRLLILCITNYINTRHGFSSARNFTFYFCK